MLSSYFSPEEERRLTSRLTDGAAQMGLNISSDQAAALIGYLGALLSWNEKVNLTAISDPAEAVEHHLLDALAASPLVSDLPSVMDIGTGGGIPGIPLAIVHPEQQWVLVEPLKKKVGFLKLAAASLGLKNVRAIQAKALAAPEREGIPLCSGAISRAFTAADTWFELAKHYVTGPKAIFFMLGTGTDARAFADSIAQMAICRQIMNYKLPFSNIQRQILRVEMK